MSKRKIAAVFRLGPKPEVAKSEEKMPERSTLRRHDPPIAANERTGVANLAVIKAQESVTERGERWANLAASTLDVLCRKRKQHGWIRIRPVSWK
jgi:hypothetical protein